jgi:hypothetical protein
MSAKYMPNVRCPTGVDCKTPCVTLAGTGLGGSLIDLTGVDSINFNQNGCDQAIACSDESFYAKNPRVCYKFCKNNPNACNLGPNVCQKATIGGIVANLFNDALGGINALNYGGCDLYCQDNPGLCDLNSNCSIIMNDPNLYNTYKSKGLLACGKYCMTKNSSCGLSTLCSNSSNYTDPRCIDYCKQTGDCDVALATYCNDINNVNNKSLCKDYYCTMVNPAACQASKIQYCKDNITDPVCRDFCSNGCSISVNGLTTGCSITNQCDDAAITYCSKVLNPKCSDPVAYSAMSARDKADCDFCSCINSSLSSYGNPACIDANCLQRGGYQTMGMKQVASNGGCPTCMQIINASGQYFSINGVTQQMNCAGGKVTSFTQVAQPLALVAKYSMKWKTSSQGTSANNTGNVIPGIDVRNAAFISELPTSFSGMSQSDIISIWVQVFNVMGEFNYDTTNNLRPYTLSDAKYFINRSVGGASGSYSAIYSNLVSQYNSYPLTDPSSIFFTGTNSSLSANGYNVAVNISTQIASEIAALKQVQSQQAAALAAQQAAALAAQQAASSNSPTVTGNNSSPSTTSTSGSNTVPTTNPLTNPTVSTNPLSQSGSSVSGSSSTVNPNATSSSSVNNSSNSTGSTTNPTLANGNNNGASVSGSTTVVIPSTIQNYSNTPTSYTTPSTTDTPSVSNVFTPVTNPLFGGSNTGTGTPSVNPLFGGSSSDPGIYNQNGSLTSSTTSSGRTPSVGTTGTGQVSSAGTNLSGDSITTPTIPNTNTYTPGSLVGSVGSTTVGSAGDTSNTNGSGTYDKSGKTTTNKSSNYTMIIVLIVFVMIISIALFMRSSSKGGSNSSYETTNKKILY